MKTASCTARKQTDTTASFSSIQWSIKAEARCAFGSSQVEKQRNQDEQNWKAQMDAVHDVLDTKAPAGLFCLSKALLS